MHESYEKKKEVTINDAMSEIATIEAQIHSTGAVDVEPNLLNHIRIQLEKGEIQPEEAMQRARSVLSSRQDYH